MTIVDNVLKSVSRNTTCDFGKIIPPFVATKVSDAFLLLTHEKGFRRYCGKPCSIVFAVDKFPPPSVEAWLRCLT